MSGAAVVTNPAGVTLQVSSTGPAGTYLNLVWTGGGGGDPVPTMPARWNLNAPPGELQLSCPTASVQGTTKAVTVTDPGGFWSTTTLADLDCPPGMLPSSS